MHKLKESRKKKSLTQNELAKQVGVGQQMISYWENDVQGMPVRHAKKIAQILNVKWWELYD